ncbi:RTA1-containing protein [Glarea lozoyensis ATCC 20868]|uniref:RTA1-containing protein n=1 Tax=Glarea lozoyensis (strain ATCC 20868 / MF5171) TaxID=1116229 RepID=S3CQI0_GLAL2|nr:RTA1-containing protein [Glarea lozoyensis ATCC 20868]EPE27950.1 RTA1-containing protein [Glarea lozoyensis ATCC 20868]
MQLNGLLVLAIATAGASAIVPLPSKTPVPTLVHRDELSTTSSTPLPTGDFIGTQFITLPGETNAYFTRPAETITLAIPTCIQTIVPDKNGYVPPGTCGSNFAYYPSFSAAIATTVIFGILTGVHIFLAAKWKATYCWVLVLGSIWEVLAFLFRTISTKHQQSSGIVLVSQLFILLAPLLINAHSYITLARLLQTFHPAQKLLGIRAHHLSLIFVCLDILAFAIQLTGGSWASPTDSTEKQLKGIHIYMGGIGIQQFFIVLFVGLCIKFHTEMGVIDRNVIVEEKGRWKKLLCAVYASLGFITIRIIFRLVQFTAGKEGETNNLVGKEVYLYVLEAVPMILATLCFIVVHPGPVVVSKMPSVFGSLRNKFGIGRGTQGKASELKGLDSERSAYMELQNDAARGFEGRR